MNLERERKFLVDLAKVPNLDGADRRLLSTGYFTGDGIAIRAAVSSRGVGKVCFKSPGGEERMEFEYEVPLLDATALVAMAPAKLTKIRYEFDGWELDEFTSDNVKGLCLAEWEEAPGKQPIPNPLPAWITKEVTNDPIYSNQALAWNYGREESWVRRMPKKSTKKTKSLWKRLMKKMTTFFGLRTSKKTKPKTSSKS